MILNLVEGFFGMADSGPDAPERLARLRRELGSVNDLPSLEKLRASLTESVRSVMAPWQQTKTANGEAAGPLMPGLLSQRKAAEDAIRASLALSGKTFVVTMVMDSLQAINQAYGNEVGDRVLRELGLHIQRNLALADRLYRWTGPTFTALLRREESIDEIRAMIRRVLEPPPEKEFDADGRKVRVPLSTVWSVVALIPPASNIYSHIDRFVASQRPRELV
jgi:diguanylate cyclase (GGDEF)-like protein